MVYMSAQKEDGNYDFHENYGMSNPGYKADLAAGDFEPLASTICQVITLL